MPTYQCLRNFRPLDSQALHALESAFNYYLENLANLREHATKPNWKSTVGKRTEVNLP